MSSITASAISTTTYDDFTITLISAIIGFLGALLGAFIGGFITHLSSKKTLKKDLQINACELLISKINILSSTIYQCYLNLTYIKGQLESYNENIYNNNFEAAKTRSNNIKSKLESHEKNYNLLIIHYNDFIDTYESKEVILHDFKKIYKRVNSDIRPCPHAHSTFAKDFKDIILSQLESNSSISDELLNKIVQSWENCDIKDVKSLKHLIDFKTELQNYYFSGLFKNYKIPKRIPENPKDTILSLDDFKENVHNKNHKGK